MRITETENIRLESVTINGTTMAEIPPAAADSRPPVPAGK